MPKINVYLPDELAVAVKDAQLPVSAICQAALERAVRDVESVRGAEEPPPGDRASVGLFGRFTPRARQALTLAQEAAREGGYSHVATEHVLLGVIDEGSNLALKVLESVDIDPADVRDELVASMERPRRRASPASDIPFSPDAKHALELTSKEALTMGHNYVGCEHLLLGVLATDEGLASKVLRRMGLELRTTRHAVVTALIGFVQGQQRSAKTATLDQILERLDAIERRLAD